MRSSFFSLGIGFGVLALAVAGCFTDESLQICAGQKGCDCRPDNSCNAGLSCNGGHCTGSGVDNSSSSSSVSTTSDNDAQTGGDDGSIASDDGSSGSASTSSSGSASTSSSSMQGSTTSNPGSNVVTNGDFSQGTTLWGIVSGSSDTATLAVTGSQLCATVTGGSPILGWPQSSSYTAPTLTAGTSYTFSYQASGPSGISIDAKIGNTMASTNYATDYDTSPSADAVSTSLQTFTHTFTAANADASTGIAFTIKGATASQVVCFANVSLVQN